MKKIYSIMILALMGVVLSSCNRVEFYDAPFLGTWDAVYYVENGYRDVLYRDEVHSYVFYSDGTGVYRGYDKYGYEYQDRFYWDEGVNGKLYLRYRDGGNQVLFYDFDRRYLLLTEDPSFRRYYMYEPY